MIPAKEYERNADPSAAIEKVGMSVSQLDDVTPAGAALAKVKLLELVSSGGHLARINLGEVEFERIVTRELPSVLRDALTQQTMHAQRTHMSVDRIQSLILQQHSANQCGVFMRFYTDETNRDKLITEFLVCDAIEIDLDLLSGLSGADAQIIEDLPKRVIMTIDETWKLTPTEEGFDRTIEFFQNEGADEYVSECFKKILSKQFNFLEVTINSMCDMQNNERVRVQRDRTSSWGYAWSSVPTTDRHQTDGNDQTHQAHATDETDPIEDTDPVDGTASDGESEPHQEETAPQIDPHHFSFEEMD